MTTIHEDYGNPAPLDRLSRTDDERIQCVVPLPPPEHLIRFFLSKELP